MIERARQLIAGGVLPDVDRMHWETTEAGQYALDWAARSGLVETLTGEPPAVSRAPLAPLLYGLLVTSLSPSWADTERHPLRLVIRA